MRKVLISAISLYALSVAGAAHAADADDEPTITVLGIKQSDLTTATSTGSRLNLSILDTPASVETISGDAIRARGDLSIIEAVTRATGLTNVGNPGNGGLALAARGFDGPGSVMILYDGVRLYPGAGTVTFPTDPWTVDRIEVLRGPASVLYGQGAIGGAVNVVSRKPNTDRLHVDAEAGYGSQNSWRVAAGVGAPITDILSFRVDASRIGSDGWVDRGRSKGLAISGSIRLAPSEDFAITLSDDYSDQKPMRYFGTPLIDGKLDDRNRRLNYNATDAVLHYKDNRTTLKAEWTVAEGIKLNSVFYRLTTDRKWRNLESYFWDGGSGLVDRFDPIGIDHVQTQTGNQTTLAVSTPIGGIKNDLVVGFDVNRIKFLHRNNFYPTAAYNDGVSVNPFNFNPGLFDTTDPILPAYRTRTRQYSLFAEDRVELTDQLSLIAGVNHEEAHVKRWTIATAGAAIGSETPLPVLDKKLHNTTWRVGGVYKPVPTVSLYAQYATAVDPLGSLITYSVGQADFKNATGDQIEAGLKAGFLDGRGNFTFAAYRIVKKNLLVRNLALPPSAPLEQIGKRSSKGLEASLTLDLPQGFGLEANAALLDAKYDDFNAGGVSYNGNTPTNVAEFTGNLWLSYTPVHQLQLRTGLRYVGRTFSDAANEFRIPAYAVVDGGISYAVTNNIAANLRVYNLFDRRYATNAYNDEQWLLGRPRSVDASISLRF